MPSASWDRSANHLDGEARGGRTRIRLYLRRVKGALFNVVFLELKDGLFAAMFVGLPLEADVRQHPHSLSTARIRRETYNSTSRRALAQLGVSDIIAAHTLATARERAHIGVEFFRADGAQGAVRHLPIEFVVVCFRSPAGTTVDCIVVNAAQAQE